MYDEAIMKASEAPPCPEGGKAAVEKPTAKKADPVERGWSIATYVYFDLETIPTQDDAYRDRIAETITPPGNIKKPESIDAWLIENRDAAAQEKIDKTSFDGGRGHVCTIAWAKNGADIHAEHAERVEDEEEVIRAFFEALDPFHSQVLTGHNITGFDVPFLLKRAVKLGIPLPAPTTLPRDPKPWDKTVFDTMTAWAGGRDRISMNDLCEILSIPGKDGMDGSMVAQAWADGRHEEIRRYCCDDVERTREIHKRFLAAGF